MNTRPGGLGRGLGELFQRTDNEPRNAVATSQDAGQSGTQASHRSAPLSDGSWFQEVPVAAIVPNPRQPRQAFDEESLEELAASVVEVGLLQPIVVRQVGDGYELIMGERRWRAHQLAGLRTIPAIVRATDDTALLRDALLENLHRAQLNPLEEAAAYQQMLDDFSCTQEDLAARVHKSRPHISNTIRLLKLPTAVQRRVAAGVLSAGHARALLMVDDATAMERLATRIVAEGLSVRATEELVAMGEAPAAQRKPRMSPQPSERAQQAAAELSNTLDTRVKVDLGRRKGRIVIEFAGEDDLDRILGTFRGIPR